MIDDRLLHSALEKAKGSENFGEEAWLTFYLVGQTTRLESMAEALISMRGRNLDGAEGCFVYAKVPIELRADEIRTVISKVSELAEVHGVNISLIDLDSSAEVTRSEFFTLHQANS